MQTLWQSVAYIGQALKLEKPGSYDPCGHVDLPPELK